MKKNTTTETTSDLVIPVERIARSLGISARTVKDMSARGDFPPPLKLGVHKKLYLLSTVQAWWQEHVSPSPFPLAPAAPDDDDQESPRATAAGLSAIGHN